MNMHLSTCDLMLIPCVNKDFWGKFAFSDQYNNLNPAVLSDRIHGYAVGNTDIGTLNYCIKPLCIWQCVCVCVLYLLQISVSSGGLASLCQILNIKNEQKTLVSK